MDLTIGEKIGDLISEKRINNKILAKEIGISEATISEIVSDKKSKDGSGKGFNYQYFIKIAKYFNVSTDYLFGLTEFKTTDTNLKSVCNYTGLYEESVKYLSTQRAGKNPCIAMLFNAFIKRLSSSLDFTSTVIELRDYNFFAYRCLEDINNLKEYGKDYIPYLLTEKSYNGNFISTKSDYKNKDLNEIIEELEEAFFNNLNNVHSSKFLISRCFDKVLEDYSFYDFKDITFQDMEELANKIFANFGKLGDIDV